MEINLDIRECTYVHHHLHSRYPKKEVPIELFQKAKTVLKTCQDCRNYFHDVRTTSVSKNREIFQQSVASGGDLLVCSITSHKNKGSIHPRNAVPIDLFRKEPGNIKSELFPSCKDCRNHKAKVHKDYVNKQKIIAQKNNKFSCSNCCKHLECSDRALNKDNTLSVLCVNCKDSQNLQSQKLKEMLIAIKLEFIEEYKANCCLCKIIYLKDPINNCVLEVKTYAIDNKRYVDFDEEQYETKDFLKSFSSKLELKILQFDHLTEEEQREKRLLLPHEEYIPKKYPVSRACSESSMRLESLKCQLLCARCHVMETMRREGDVCSQPYNERLDYTNKLKLQGCEICKYTNPDLPKFFDFDHVDPTTKIDKITNMVRNNKYTFDELITEISKCRILCRHCHLIHTKKQIDSGIVANFKSKNINL